MDGAKLAELQAFVDYCKSNPSVLNDPSLAFFRNFLESLGAKLPKDPKPKQNRDESMEDEIVESDIELDEAEVKEADNDPPQKMGDPFVEVTEENRDAAQMAKLKAMDAISEGQLDEAVQLLTEAILLNPSSAILYAARGYSTRFTCKADLCSFPAGVYVKLSKPNAAIRDADAALQINSDSAKGYKFRGIARAMLGHWEDAAKDLHVASNLDYDEQIASMLKKVEPNAHRIEEHRRKYERLRKERELRKPAYEKQRQKPEAQTTYERQKKKEHPSESKTSDSELRSALKDGNVLIIHSASELEAKFSAAKSLSRLVILYFTATWCGPCRYISPLYESLAGKYPKVVFVKVDIDKVSDVAARWNISSVPTFIFIKDGKEIDKVIGADKSGLERKIGQHATE